jgi:hypothetical protein
MANRLEEARNMTRNAQSAMMEKRTMLTLSSSVMGAILLFIKNVMVSRIFLKVNGYVENAN